MFGVQPSDFLARYARHATAIGQRLLFMTISSRIGAQMARLAEPKPLRRGSPEKEKNEENRS
jgi:hypothetical protein